MEIKTLIKQMNYTLSLVGANVIQKSNLGKNIFEVKDSQGNVVKNLYIKISKLKKPFWGLTNNRIIELQNQLVDYDVILISLNEIRVISSQNIRMLIQTLNIASDGDYKLNYNDIKNIGFLI